MSILSLLVTFLPGCSTENFIYTLSRRFSFSPRLQLILSPFLLSLFNCPPVSFHHSHGFFHLPPTFSSSFRLSSSFHHLSNPSSRFCSRFFIYLPAFHVYDSHEALRDNDSSQPPTKDRLPDEIHEHGASLINGGHTDSVIIKGSVIILGATAVRADTIVPRILGARVKASLLLSSDISFCLRRS